MRLVKIFNEGKVINETLYEKLQALDDICFPGAEGEFQKNRDWWVCCIDGEIIAYCGCIYSYDLCIFNRAWVHKSFRGRGLQRKMIKARLKAAIGRCNLAVTYTMSNNLVSANNLIKSKFLLYTPSWKWAGNDCLYFCKNVR
jgi:GNAT superfamily N-acetyltransferase